MKVDFKSWWNLRWTGNWNDRKAHEIIEDMESEFVKYTEPELEWFFHRNHIHDH